jgi:hypothetical protein
MTPVEGIDLLKAVTKAEWLRCPQQSMEPFEQHHCSDAYYHERGASTARWQYDKHAAYLACASSVKLGVGDYVRLEECENAERLGMPGPGLYLVDIPEQSTQLFPHLFHIGVQHVYTPLLTLAIQANVVFTVRQAIYYPEQHYALRAFYEHCKAKREAGEEVKHLYTQAFGMLAHKPQRLWNDCLYRPDWWNLLKAELKARMYRQAWQVYEAEGVWPIKIHTDSLYYADQVHSLRLGEGIGAYREVHL